MYVGLLALKLQIASFRPYRPANIETFPWLLERFCKSLVAKVPLQREKKSLHNVGIMSPMHKANGRKIW